MPIIAECNAYLTTNATGVWYETYRLKDPKTENYMYPTQRDMIVLRVEGSKNRRAFYWMYNIQDAINFNQFVGLKLKMEAHEVIITPRCRMFYDIDLKLTEYQKSELAESMNVELTDTNEDMVMQQIGKRLGVVFKEATLISLEDHGIIESELAGFDWLSTMRNRPLVDDGYKISIHIITNLMLSLKACAAIADHVKSGVLSDKDNIEVLMINEDIAELLIDSIDTTQYHRNGSLSLPFGTKMCDTGVSTNWIYREYDVANQQYFITAEDMFAIQDLDLSEYNIANDASYSGEAADPHFVSEALKHVSNIKDYSARVWDISTSMLRKSTMYVKRYASSLCSVCDRVHDNDNTLFLIFNSERGTASWKCARRPDMKPIVFYQADAQLDDEPDLDAFAQKHQPYASSRTTPSQPVESKPSKQKNKQHQQGAFATEDSEAFAKRYSTLPMVSIVDLEDPSDIAPPKPLRPSFKTGANTSVPLDDFKALVNVAELNSDDDEPEMKPKKGIQTRRSNRKQKITSDSSDDDEPELPSSGDDEPEMKPKTSIQARRSNRKQKIIYDSSLDEEVADVKPQCPAITRRRR